MLEWLKRNKFALIVVVVFVLYEFTRVLFGTRTSTLSNLRVGSTSSIGAMGAPAYDTFGAAKGMGSISVPGIMPETDYTPQTSAANRLVIQESNLALLVKDVVDTRKKIIGFAESKGGYMVNSSTSNPQDAPTATISIRIPASTLEQSLEYFHSLSIKVVSENLLGRDVTDQYVDIDTRISQIQGTVARLNGILNQATEISDITNLTNQILNYQNQIDSLKGQKLSLEKNAELAKLTVYLSTDEIALPYAPSETFRPAVVFKLAVRSLVGTLRGIATDAIWLLVYSVVWLPALLIFLYVRRYLKNRKPNL